MMYVGEEPWHGLGTKLDKPATAAEAIKAANLDWRVIKAPLHASVNQGKQLIPLEDKYAIIREDKQNKEGCPVFGIVGSGYTPLQNTEAFQFFDDIVGQRAAIYHTAGALGEGERIWILAKLPDEIRVVEDDIAEKFLLLSNSHNGESSVQIKFTPIRVVCHNTLTMALSRGPTVRVVHLPNIQERLRQAERLLGIIDRRFNELGDNFRAMVKRSINTDELVKYLTAVFPEPRDGDDRNSPRFQKSLQRCLENRLWASYFFEAGKGNTTGGAKGTLWAAYNGVTEFIDQREIGRTPERRLESVWFGDGYFAKARAFNVAQEILAGRLN
jgi:phage/plasmid-like protein (TIGR03299 family)